MVVGGQVFKEKRSNGLLKQLDAQRDGEPPPRCKMRADPILCHPLSIACYPLHCTYCSVCSGRGEAQ